MKEHDLHEVVAQLETLESLANLFRNLWFAKVKAEIRDEKVKAYLMVFDDAFPGMNQVIQFMHRNARALAEGETARVREEFEVLSQRLLQREIETDLTLDEDLEMDEATFEGEAPQAAVHDGLTADERSALEQVDQGDVEAAFAESLGMADAPAPARDIDALFTSSRRSATGRASQREIEEFLAAEDGRKSGRGPDAEGEADLEVDEEAEPEVDLEDLLEEEVQDDVVEEDEEEEGEGEGDGLEDLLIEGESEGDEEVDLAELLGDEEEADEEDEEGEGSPAAEDEEELDLSDLLAEEEEETEAAAEISPDEMAVLLGEDEADGTRTKPRKQARPEPPAARPAAPKQKGIKGRNESAGNGDEVISQDEIDALLA